MTTMPRLLTMLALAGVAGGCSYTSDSAWNDSPEDDGSNDGRAPVVAMNGSGNETTEGASWSELVSNNSETEDVGVARGAGTPPVDVFGDVSGRAFAQGNPAAADAYDASDLSRVSFSTVGADFDPVISNDGMFSYFASTRHRETADIYRKHVQSRVVTQITTDPGHDVMPSLSPGGDRSEDHKSEHHSRL
ncbi:MAG: hypothetical protein AAFO89_00885, partial [Planctomycetota bacterium]